MHKAGIYEKRRYISLQKIRRIESLMRVSSEQWTEMANPLILTLIPF